MWKCQKKRCTVTFGFVCVCLSSPYLRLLWSSQMNVANTDAADGPKKSCCAQFCECLKWSWCLFKLPFFLVFFILAAVLGLLGLVLGIVLLPLRCVASGWGCRYIQMNFLPKSEVHYLFVKLIHLGDILVETLLLNVSTLFLTSQVLR
jgi:hypothetical protein